MSQAQVICPGSSSSLISSDGERPYNLGAGLSCEKAQEFELLQNTEYEERMDAGRVRRVLASGGFVCVLTEFRQFAYVSFM